MMDEIKKKDYISDMNDKIEYALNSSRVDFSTDISAVEQNLNLLEELFRLYYTAITVDGRDEFSIMALIIINKNIDFLYATYILTKQGQFGAARTLFRNIYESLILIKTASLTGDDTLVSSWLDGKSINIGKKIFRNVTYPKSIEMEIFWKNLCKFCHGTVYASSQVIDYDNSKQELAVNYALIEMLIYMNYHVLNIYVFSDRMKAMIKNLLPDDIMVEEKLVIATHSMKSIKEKMNKMCNRILIDFSKKWRFKD